MAGVLAGLADYTKIDVPLWRIVFVIGMFATAIVPFVLGYILAWFIIPVRPADAAKTVIYDV